MIAQRYYKVGTKVLLDRAAHRGEEAIVLEPLPNRPVSLGQYPGTTSALREGADGEFCYRVRVIRTEQELVERAAVLRPCCDTEYETEELR